MLNALPASMTSTVLVFYPSNMECAACTGASQPVSSPEHTLNEAAEDIMVSRRVDTTTLKVMYQSTSPTPIGAVPEFCPVESIYMPQMLLN